MVTLKYRLVGDVKNPVFSKEFNSRVEATLWAKAQGNILIVEIESSGAAAFNHIFGGK